MRIGVIAIPRWWVGRRALSHGKPSRYQAQPGPARQVLLHEIHDPPHGFPVVQTRHQVRPDPDDAVGSGAIALLGLGVSVRAAVATGLTTAAGAFVGVRVRVGVAFVLSASVGVMVRVAVMVKAAVGAGVQGISVGAGVGARVGAGAAHAVSASERITINQMGIRIGAISSDMALLENNHPGLVGTKPGESFTHR